MAPMAEILIPLIGFSILQVILWWWFDFRMHRSLDGFLKRIFGDTDF
jgi:hypothetical protein